MGRLNIEQSVDINFVDDHHANLNADQPSLLFFNGATLPLAFWDPIVERLQAHYRCIRFDQRNAGATRFAGTFTLNDIAADAARLLDHLAVTEVVAIGHAWGGRVAQVFARDYPHLVRAMMVCGTGGQLPAVTDPQTLKAMRHAAKVGDRGAWEDALHETFCGAGFREREPQVFAALSEVLWSQPPHADAVWDAAVTPSSSYWGSTRLPTLLLYGTEDKNGTPDNARDLAAKVPGAELEFFAHAGHFVIREAADPVGARMLQFLQAL